MNSFIAYLLQKSNFLSWEKVSFLYDQNDLWPNMTLSSSPK